MDSIDELELETQVMDSWRHNLAEFKSRIYPELFEPYGFSFPQAFLVWQINKLANELTEEDAEG
jgi:hypothetical protein